MSIDIPRPNINAPTEAGRLEQVRSYLYQISEQLNWALNTIETDTGNKILEISRQNSAASETPEDVQSNFNSIKSLIIKSADIVDEYYEKISKRLEGVYVASGEFGEYKEETSNTLEANSKNITSIFENIQNISSELESIKDSYIDTEAYIKAGELYDDDGIPMYGIEIGQTTVSDGKEVFNKFARFTSDKLSFYDTEGDEMAYISDKTLVITNAVIGGILTHGGYEISSTATHGLVYMWKGWS